LVYFDILMNNYLRQLLIKVGSERYHQISKFGKLPNKIESSLNNCRNYKTLLEKGSKINKIIREKFKMYSRDISNGNDSNGNGHSNRRNPELQRLRYEIDKAEFASERAYKEFQKAERDVERLRSVLYHELGIQDDFFMFNLDFLKSRGLSEILYSLIFNYNIKVIDHIAKYKKYIMALNRYESAVADYAIRTEGPRAIDQKRWEIKMAYREAEIQYADTTIELRIELNKLLKAIKYLIEAEHKFAISKNKLEKSDLLNEDISQVQDKAIEAFYEYQDRLKDYYEARKSVSEKVREYKEARINYEMMQQEYEESLRDIMAN